MLGQGRSVGSPNGAERRSDDYLYTACERKGPAGWKDFSGSQGFYDHECVIELWCVDAPANALAGHGEGNDVTSLRRKEEAPAGLEWAGASKVHRGETSPDEGRASLGNRTSQGNASARRRLIQTTSEDHKKRPAEKADRHKH
jgi:hypothetical protein